MYAHERSLVEQLADKPFALIGVNSDADRDEIRDIVKDKNLSWRSFWNGPQGTRGPISRQWEVSGWPTLYLIDADGVIRHGGQDLRRNLDQRIEELLAEIGHDVQLEHDN